MRLFLFLVLIALSGCAHASRAKKTARSQIAPQPHSLLGTVSLVDETNGFVLIDIGNYAPPETGQALKTFTDGMESGVLAVSAERRPPYIVADIVKGVPKRGDAVFQ